VHGAPVIKTVPARIEFVTTARNGRRNGWPGDVHRPFPLRRSGGGSPTARRILPSRHLIRRTALAASDAAFRRVLVGGAGGTRPKLVDAERHETDVVNSRNSLCRPVPDRRVPRFRPILATRQAGAAKRNRLIPVFTGSTPTKPL